MPYSSKSQARAMHAKAAKGQIKPSVVKEFNAVTDFKALPEKKSSGGLKAALEKK